MAFTVSDFHDLIVILEENPVWRAELRRLVLTDEILGLPQALRELTQVVRELAEAQRRYEEKSEARFTRIEVDIHELKTDVSQLKTDVSKLQTDMGRLNGRTLQQMVRERIPTYLSRFALRLRPLTSGSFAELLEVAVEEERISEEQADDAKLIEAVTRGRRRGDGAAMYLAVEISSIVDEHDLSRAVRRAAMVAEATNTITLPVVVGETIRSDVRNQADRLGAGYVVVPQE
jgi:hypothetical protein